MKKHIQITGEIEHVGIMSPEVMPEWKIMVKLSVDPKPVAKEVYYVATHEDGPDDPEKFEPGMYVTIHYYAPNFLERGEQVFILADEIIINEEETMKNRNQFSFKEFETDEYKGILHRQMIEAPRHVSDNNFTFNK